MYTPSNRTGFFADAKRSLALQALDKKRAVQAVTPARQTQSSHLVDTTTATTINTNTQSFDSAFEMVNGKTKSPVSGKYHKLAQGFKDDQERQRIKFQDKRTTEKVSNGVRVRHHKDDPCAK